MNKKLFRKESVLPVALLCSALAFSPIGGSDAFAAIHTTQQAQAVKGTVVDENGEAIIGASIKVVGTTNGVITDLDGNFALANVSKGAVLEISYIGYITQRVKVAGASVSVVLKEDN